MLTLGDFQLAHVTGGGDKPCQVINHENRPMTWWKDWAADSRAWKNVEAQKAITTPPGHFDVAYGQQVATGTCFAGYPVHVRAGAHNVPEFSPE